MTVLIKKYEGKSLSPYLCPKGVPTIGYGITVYPDGRKEPLKKMSKLAVAGRIVRACENICS
jgi:GH24 family phage-related lysozyme (muramidase)